MASPAPMFWKDDSLRLAVARRRRMPSNSTRDSEGVCETLRTHSLREGEGLKMVIELGGDLPGE